METGSGADLLQKSLRERFRRHFKRSCALLRSVSLHKSVADTFLAPFGGPPDPGIYGSRRSESIDFLKISISAFDLDFDHKITSQNDMALKTRPRRLKSAPRRS